MYSIDCFIKQFYMISKQFNMDQLETGIDSPFKNNSNRIYQIIQPPKKQFIQIRKEDVNLSSTQIHLNSKPIVRKLLQTTKNKTVRHQINQIDKESSLYTRPSRYSPNEFHFDSIPPSNPNYSSSCSAKIKQINMKFRQKYSSSLAATRSHSQNKEPYIPQKKGQQRVSISGLITYKFNSINAQRSLGFNQINHEQNLKEEIKNSRKVCQCPTNRFKNILLKNTHKRYIENMRQEKSILSNFSSGTDRYLKQRIRENQEELMVYGEKARKLHFIKDYMHSEKATYSEGRHIIDQIQRLEPDLSPQPKLKCKTEVDEDVQFELRVKPMKRKRVKIRYLTFID